LLNRIDPSIGSDIKYNPAGLRHDVPEPLVNPLPVAAIGRQTARKRARPAQHPAEMRADALLNPALVQQKWVEHQSGRRNWQYALWPVLMFQQWKRRWG
jgi:hypothetical protein